jgi:hypothetical protein
MKYPKSVRIECEGISPYGTKVFDAETGEEIHNVRSVEWQHRAGSIPTAKIEVLLAGVSVKGQVREMREHLSTRLGKSIRQLVSRMLGNKS